jgi:hypothetical protein
MLLVAVSLLALAGDPSQLRLDVLEGRVRVAHEQGTASLSVGAVDWVHGPSGYLESSTLARLRLRWLGAASMELEGAHALAWQPARAEGSGLWLSFSGLDEARLEVREGPLRFELPSGWRGLCSKGTLALRSGVDGHVDLELLAGAPLLLSPPSSPGAVRPPWTVLPGARVRLLCGDPRPRVVAGKLRAPDPAPGAPAMAAPVGERPWSGFEWPWKSAESPASRGWGPGW